jgi:hypothetical protein
MYRNQFTAVVCFILALIFTLGTPRRMHAQDSKNPYPNMAPLEQYLMDSEAEIALARSAAPDSISRDATILVLGRHGYETAVQGKNGFVCSVDRGWAANFDSPEFWNPKVRGAICFNPAAAHSVLPAVYLRAQLALAGASKAQIADRLRAAYAKKELPALEPAAMSYMLSKQAYLTDSAITKDGAHDVAHLMFYSPIMDSMNWGADLSNSPVHLLSRGDTEPFEIFLVCAGAWSDGSPAPLD